MREALKQLEIEGLLEIRPRVGTFVRVPTRREIVERAVGEELAQRGKWGFGVPVERWLRTSLAPACDWLFEPRRLARHGVLDPSSLNGPRREAWLRNDPMVVWHAFALAAWCEAHLGEGGDAVRERLRVN